MPFTCLITVHKSLCFLTSLKAITKPTVYSVAFSWLLREEKSPPHELKLKTSSLQENFPDHRVKARWKKTLVKEIKNNNNKTKTTKQQQQNPTAVLLMSLTTKKNQQNTTCEVWQHRSSSTAWEECCRQQQYKLVVFLLHYAAELHHNCSHSPFSKGKRRKYNGRGLR